jgi:hypothetical protein
MDSDCGGGDAAHSAPTGSFSTRSTTTRSSPSDACCDQAGHLVEQDLAHLRPDRTQGALAANLLATLRRAGMNGVHAFVTRVGAAPALA